MRRHTSWRALSVVVSAILAAPPAQASEVRVLLDAEAGVRNDGNYGQATQAGIDPEDIQGTSVGRAGFNLQLSTDIRERFFLALGYSPSYERMLSSEDNDQGHELTGTAHRLDLGLRGDLTRRLAFQVHERLLKTPNLNLDVPPTAADSMAVARRGDQLHHSLDVTLNQELTRRFSVLAGVFHTLREFEAPDLFDAETLGAHLNAAWRWTERQSLEATAGLETFDFENGRRSDVQTLDVGYVRPLGRDTMLNLEAGIYSVDTVRPGQVLVPVEPGEPGTGTMQELDEIEATGWRGAVSLSQQRRLFHWDAGYRHDIAPGYGLGRETKVDNLFAGLSTTVGRRLVLGLDGNASWHRELDERAAEGDSGTLLKFAAGTARASWAVLPALRLTGGYSRVWQESDVEPFDNLSYDRYFLGLAFRIFERGETPRTSDDLERLGEPTDAATPDDQ